MTGDRRIVSDGWDGWLASHNILRILPKPFVNSGYILAFLLSQYGILQMKSKNLGAVVDVLTPENLAEIWVPNAPLDVQQAIGEKVVMAYEKKDEANTVEDAAIRRIEYLFGRTR